MPRYTHHHQVNIDDLRYYCFWCPKLRHQQPLQQLTTYIEFDLALHMYEHHRMAMVKLPIGRGNMQKRIDYAVEQCKLMTKQLREHPERWGKIFTEMSITAPGTIITATDIVEKMEKERGEEENTIELIEDPRDVVVDWLGGEDDSIT